jgi:hypothetical protein
MAVRDLGLSWNSLLRGMLLQEYLMRDKVEDKVCLIDQNSDRNVLNVGKD